jgi:TrpR-related protein YerC/YecD
MLARYDTSGAVMGIPMKTGDWRNDNTAALFDAVLTLESRDEAAAFFRDLCTYRELEEMTSRWAVVRLLDDGIPYREIHDRTGVSTATITRINQWLRHGTGGYRSMLDRLNTAQEG